MALAGLTSVPALAIALLVVGWWARNLRSPPRRALLVESVPAQRRGEAFGFLHALDVGGGMLAAGYAFLLLVGGVAYSTILLVTIPPPRGFDARAGAGARGTHPAPANGPGPVRPWAGPPGRSRDAVRRSPVVLGHYGRDRSLWIRVLQHRLPRPDDRPRDGR
ncbi:major facilitator superfamily MFS_1, partial [mine drainage metagenome]